MKYCQLRPVKRVFVSKGPVFAKRTTDDQVVNRACPGDHHTYPAISASHADFFHHHLGGLDPGEVLDEANAETDIKMYVWQWKVESTGHRCEIGRAELIHQANSLGRDIQRITVLLSK